MELRIEAAKIVLGCEPRKVEEQYNSIMSAIASVDYHSKDVPDDVEIWQPFEDLSLEEVVNLIDGYEELLMGVWNRALIKGARVALDSMADQIKNDEL